MSSQPQSRGPGSAPLREPGLYFRTALLPGGWEGDVRIQTAGGRISVVESGVAPLAGDERAGIGLPGVVNAHSHAFQRGMAGLTESRHSSQSDSFWSWRELMYRFVGRLEPEDLEALAAQAFAEMLEAGFTRVCEFHYVHHDLSGTPYADLAEMGARVAAAASGSGIGLTLLPVFYAHSGFGGQALGPQQARFGNDVDRFGQLVEASRHAVSGLPDALIGIAPHSLRAVTPEELRAILPLAAGGPVHIHVAEQMREVQECVAALGARPVQWLMAEMPVNAQWCLVHATHVTEQEVAALARSQAVAGLCPMTEANLGDGVFPAASFQAARGAYAVGSDSNVLISLSEELRLLEYGQRLRDGARNVLAPGQRTRSTSDDAAGAGSSGGSTGRALFEGVVRGGLQAAGLTSAASSAGTAESGTARASTAAGAVATNAVATNAVATNAVATGAVATGAVGLAVGASADLVSLREDDVALAARSGDAILDSFVFASHRGVIDGVWRAGRKVVSGGVHIHRAPIAARFRATLQRLLSA